MKPRLSEQDLTDYALNELDPRQRLYVESVLAVSEPCREDIYQTIDLAMMLEEGFEAQEVESPVSLEHEQRAKLLAMPVKNRALPITAMLLAAAACLALALVHREDWLPGERASQVARASIQGSQYVVDTRSGVETEQLDFRRLAGDLLTKSLLSADEAGGGEGAGGIPFAGWEYAPNASFE